MSVQKLLIALVTVLLTFIASSSAQAQTPLEEYRAQSLRLFQGQLLQGDKAIDLGFAGGNYKELFKTSPLALKEASLYRRYRLTGLIVGLTGCAMVIGGLIPVLGSFEEELSPGEALFAVGLLGGGGITSAVGVGFQIAAQWKLEGAIDAHNRDLFERLKLRSKGAGRSLRLTWAVSF